MTDHDPAPAGAAPQPDSHLSRLAVERAALDELPASARDAARAHLAGCAACRDRVAALRADNLRFGQAPERAAQVDALVARLTVPAPRRRRWPGVPLGAVAALAAALALWAWPRRHEPASPDQVFDGRGKGEPGLRLEVVRRTAQGAQSWISDGAQVRSGDALRFRVHARAPGHVAILSLDAAQLVSVYAPAGPAQVPLAAGQPVVLDGSVELDATLGPERLVAIVCAQPRAVAELVAAARAALDAARGQPRAVERITRDCQEATLVLDKVQP